MTPRTSFLDICAIIITRGDVDMEPILSTLPYGEILVNENGRISRWKDGEFKYISTTSDHKVFNRYVTAAYATKSVLFFQDDDVIVPDHRALLDAFNAREHERQWVANTQPGLDDAQGYFDLALVGCGSLVPEGAWDPAFIRYLKAYDNDDRFDLDADFIFGVLSHWVKVSIGLDVLDVASADNRLWRQPGQMEGKHASINKARALRTIVLTMLTKNEQANVVRALSSARPLFDSVLIHDSGSTDDTQLEVSRWCAANGVPLTVRDTTWEGFGAARNALLEDGRMLADYMLLMDADEEFVGYSDAADAVHRPTLFTDAYMLHYDGPLDYSQPRILYGNFPWRFDTVTRHAALNNETAYDGRPPIGCDMQEPKIRHHGDDNNGVGRYQADVDGLTSDIEAGHDVPRSLFMRAKAYEGLAAATGTLSYLDNAIADYRARVELSQGDEEAYYSRFRLGCLLIEHSNQFASGMDELFRAWMDRPGRVESLRALSAYATAVADATPYPVGDAIIVHRDLYTQQEEDHA